MLTNRCSARGPWPWHVLLSFGLLFAAGGVGAEAELLEPNPERTAREVIVIQLEALQTNDTPSMNSGIRQVWAFAHPRNRAVTGPLARFTRMIRGPGYNMLLKHRRHQIQRLSIGDAAAVFAVQVVSRDGGFYRFRWQLRRVSTDAGAVWMTTQVSPARRTGEQLSRRSDGGRGRT
jgi:hypothetical protein